MSFAGETTTCSDLEMTHTVHLSFHHSQSPLYPLRQMVLRSDYSTVAHYTAARFGAGVPPELDSWDEVRTRKAHPTVWSAELNFATKPSRGYTNRLAHCSGSATAK